MHLVLPSSLALALAATLLAGCAGEPHETASDDPGVVHVHGLAPDPDDPDAVLAATHTGLFRIADGEAARVGDAHHDLMGFTVTDDGAFLASGHPDLQSDLAVADVPPLLGLIRSDDGGATWESVSLLGEADLHALTVVDGTIYGGDSTSGRLLASDDGTAWEVRAELPLVSLAGRVLEGSVRLVGSGPDGVWLSEDGGRTWEPVGEVDPGWLTATSDGFLLAAPDGAVLASEDGRAWSSRGELPGRPSALGAGDGVVLAATDAGIHRSTDGGATWELVHGG